MECMRRIKHLKDSDKPKKVGIMVASHNEDTIRFAIENMKRLDIAPEDKVDIYYCILQYAVNCDKIDVSINNLYFRLFVLVSCWECVTNCPFLWVSTLYHMAETCPLFIIIAGQAGYSVYKYVPYGPVNEVLPYLSRRARENSGILTKLEKEKMLLRRELKERIFQGRMFQKPKGDYIPI